MSHSILTFDNKDEWLFARNQGIGGSEVAAILGFDSFREPFDVYWDKLHPKPDKKTSVSARRGHMLEPLIVDLFSEAYKDIDVFYDGGKKWVLHYDDDYPWRRGTPDALIVDEIGRNGILECKSTAGNNQHIWFNGIPTKYKIQTVYYMNIDQVDVGYIAYLIDDIFLNSPIVASKEYREMINRAADSFWNDHILAENPPEATSLDSLKKKYMQTIAGEIITVEQDFVDKLDSFLTKKQMKSELELQLKTVNLELEELERMIRDRFGRSEFAMFEDKVVARLQTWGKGRRLTIPGSKDMEEVLADDVYRRKIEINQGA